MEKVDVILDTAGHFISGDSYPTRQVPLVAHGRVAPIWRLRMDTRWFDFDPAIGGWNEFLGPLLEHRWTK